MGKAKGGAGLVRDVCQQFSLGLVKVVISFRHVPTQGIKLAIPVWSSGKRFRLEMKIWETSANRWYIFKAVTG